MTSICNCNEGELYAEEEENREKEKEGQKKEKVLKGKEQGMFGGRRIGVKDLGKLEGGGEER